MLQLFCTSDVHQREMKGRNADSSYRIGSRCVRGVYRLANSIDNSLLLNIGIDYAQRQRTMSSCKLRCLQPRSALERLLNL